MEQSVWVIIPVYNAEKYLEAAVASVVRTRHTYEGDISLILVNDGSTDHSAEICDRMSEMHANITVIHQENSGVSSARNKGIEYVLCKNKKGYIAFLDADDMWATGVRLKGLDEDTDLVAYSSVLANEKCDRFRIANRFDHGFIELERANVKWINDGTFAAFFYRIDLIREYRLRFMEGTKGNEDVIFWRQATFCAKHVRFCEDVLYVYRMNPSSVTHRTTISEKNALHIPYAWHLAKEWVYSLEQYTAEEKQRWIHHCEESVGARLLESARLLAEQGYRADEIRKIVIESPLMASLEQLKEEALADWQKADLRGLREDYHGFVRKHQIRGLFLKMAKKAMRVGIVRRFREKRRYRLTRV